VARYAAKRLAWSVFVLLGVTLVIQTTMSLVPGDPAVILLGESATAEQRAALRAELGLDRPFLARYAAYIGDVSQGSLGRSYRNRRPVIDEIRDALPPTLRLSLAAMIITVAVGIPAGVASAVRSGGMADRLISLLSLKLDVLRLIFNAVQISLSTSTRRSGGMCSRTSSEKT